MDPIDLGTSSPKEMTLYQAFYGFWTDMGLGGSWKLQVFIILED